ncbi:hypothetical protein BDA99DRAFT_543780 [Phascolomyces articulosus]|uniref:Uncharacterized protein n=1 Tax=Phascolomyces articulosus TaxID=60185 RepID=A0AAD5P7C7_9FUNG|nr:hypothetical protein BDA99DRAFT_543780 [Phascolomyces articulosus]
MRGRGKNEFSNKDDDETYMKNPEELLRRQKLIYLVRLPVKNALRKPYYCPAAMNEYRNQHVANHNVDVGLTRKERQYDYKEETSDSKKHTAHRRQVQSLRKDGKKVLKKCLRSALVYNNVNCSAILAGYTIFNRDAVGAIDICLYNYNNNNNQSFRTGSSLSCDLANINFFARHSSAFPYTYYVYQNPTAANPKVHYSVMSPYVKNFSVTTFDALVGFLLLKDQNKNNLQSNNDNSYIPTQVKSYCKSENEKRYNFGYKKKRKIS